MAPLKRYTNFNNQFHGGVPFHWSGNSSKRQFIKWPFHRMAFSSNLQAQIRWACAFDEKAIQWIAALMKCCFTQFHIIKGNKLLKLAIFAITKYFCNFKILKSLTQLRQPSNFFFRIFILFTSSDLPSTWFYSGNTKGGGITVLSTSCLTGLD